MAVTDSRSGDRARIAAAPVPPARHSAFAGIARLAALIAMAIGVPLALAYATGAMSIPRLDDWAFARIASTFYSTGHLHLLGWGEMTMVGHIVWGLPFIALFGRSMTALHWAGATAAALGLAGTFALYRSFVPVRLALFGTAAIAVIPIFAVLTTTYMTDLTGFAGEVVCLALGIGALRSEGRRSSYLLAGSLLFGFWAFTCRDSSFAAPLAIAAGNLLLAKRNGRSLRSPIAVGLAFIVAAAVLYAWRKALPNDESLPITRPGVLGQGRTLLVLFDSYFAVALGAIPVLALSFRSAFRLLVRSPRARWAALAVAVIGLALLAVPHYPKHDATTVLDGNVLDRFGLGGPQASRAGKRAALFPGAIWLLVNLAAVVSGALLAGIAWEGIVSRVSGWRRRVPAFRPPPVDVAVIWVYIAFNVAFLAFRAVEKGFLIDRYFLSLTMASSLLALVWLSQRGTVSLPSGAAAVALVAVLSALVVLDGDAYDTARWSVAKSAVKHGVPPTQISAGFEWIGAHHRGPLRASENILGTPERCVVVAQQPLRGAAHELVEVRRYAPIGGLLARHVWVYRELRLCGS